MYARLTLGSLCQSKMKLIARRSLGFGDLEEVKNDRYKKYGPEDSVLGSVFWNKPKLIELAI